MYKWDILTANTDSENREKVSEWTSEQKKKKREREQPLIQIYLLYTCVCDLMVNYREKKNILYGGMAHHDVCHV